VTWDPCPSKMSRCLFVMDIPLGINLLKKKNFEKKVIFHAFDYIANHTNPCFIELYVIVTYPLSSKYVKP
jgi:hypothetical protein